MGPSIVRHLDTTDLAQRCAEQTALFYQNKTSNTEFCYELFRRAILKRDSDAWEALIRQYRPQLRRCIQRIGTPDEDTVEDLTQDAILRFWRSYTAREFARASTLAEMLRYWQDCARSATLDWQRRNRWRAGTLDEENPARDRIPRIRADDEVAAREARLQLWSLVRHHCQDEVDELLAHRVFVEGCRPRQVYAEESQWFGKRSDVYARLRNLKDRLRRDAELRALLEDLIA